MTIDGILERLDGVKKSGGEFLARCPGHDDGTASLSVTEKGGKVLLFCHAGCTTESITTALGLPMSALFTDERLGVPARTAKTAGRIVEVYGYTDPGGSLLYQVCRFDPKDFRQRRPDGKDGFTWNLQGVDRVLYRVVQVIAAIAEGLPIFIVEGEKDVHSLESIGLCATCNSGGASAEWLPSYSDALAGAEVFIVPDNDPPGAKHAEDAARSLHGTARSVRVVLLPGLELHGDITSWLAGGHTAEEFAILCVDTMPWTPTAVEADDPEPAEEVTDLPILLSHSALITGDLQPIQWLVDGLIPAGGICLLAGDSGVGKSWLGYHLAQAVASGVPYLGHFTTEQGGVLYLDAESGQNLASRRFKKLWRGLTEVHSDIQPEIPLSILFSALPLDDQATCSKLNNRIQQDGVKLVILDPMIHFSGGDENASRDMATFCDSLRTIGRETGAAFLLVHHVRKQSNLSSNAAGQMIRGSTAIRGVMDSVLFAQRMKDGSLHVEHDKCRVAEVQKSFFVDLTDPDEETTTVRYGGESNASSENRTEIAEAVITDCILAGGGVERRKAIVEQCKAAGVSTRTTNDALTTLVKAGRLSKQRQGMETLYALTEATSQPLLGGDTW